MIFKSFFIITSDGFSGNFFILQLLKRYQDAIMYNIENCIRSFVQKL